MLVRNTWVPVKDFWVFKLDVDTREYMSTDLLQNIGLEDRVIHILIEFDQAILFASHDHFAEGYVILKQTGYFNDDFVNDLQQTDVIKDWYLINAN